MTAALRTGLTLAALALLLVIGVLWGFSEATRPFPKQEAAAICVDTDYSRGDSLTPADVTVNVLNASAREGLAGRTMQLLSDQGFSSGVSTNVPAGSTVTGTEIWTSDRRNPAIRLLRSYVGKVPVVERTDLPYAGLNLVVGDEFGDLAQGKATVTVRRDGAVCTPPAS